MSDRLKKKNIPVLTTALGAILGIMFWRGMWGLLDQYCFPHNLLLSNLVCLFVPIVLGVIIVIVSSYKLTWIST